MDERAERTCQCGMDLGPDGRCGDCDDAGAEWTAQPEPDPFAGLPTFKLGRY